MSPRADASEAKRDADAAGKPSAVQRVIELVLTRIRSGEYAPGQMIIAHDLMTELGVSKAPVREGIHVLVGEGVMELLPNRSARIRRLSAADLRDFVAVWGAIGGVNMRLGAEHAKSAADRARIREALKAIDRTGKTRVPYEFFMAVANLHQTLVDISGNSYIRTIIERAHFTHFHRHSERMFPGEHWPQHLEVFRKIGEALLAGDGDTAEDLYRKHMRWSLGRMK